MNKVPNRTLLNTDSNLNVFTGALVLLLLSTTFAEGPVAIMDRKKVSKLINTNIYIKYFITLCFIYFVIDFTYQDRKHPVYEGLISICILFTYIIYCNIHYQCQISIFVLLIIIYFLNDNINYYMERNKHSSLVKKYNMFKYILISLIGILMIVGIYANM